jgi:hypothetical protein
VATQRKHTDVASQVEAAIRRLREIGEPELADAVSILAKSARAWGDTEGRGENYSIWLDKAVRDAAKEKAKAEGTTLAAITRHGLEKYLNGEFRPTAPPRGGGKASLSVRLPADLVARVDVVAQSDTDLIWKPTARLIAAAYLREVYVPAPEDPRSA